MTDPAEVDFLRHHVVPDKVPPAHMTLEEKGEVTQHVPLHYTQLGTSMADIEKNLSKQRKQIGGDHYRKHDIQPIDVIDEYGLDFYGGNALKYLLRYPDKGGLEDLQKAKHYLELLIKREEAKGE
jgi:hypothetical protein